MTGGRPDRCRAPTARTPPWSRRLPPTGMQRAPTDRGGDGHGELSVVHRPGAGPDVAAMAGGRARSSERPQGRAQLEAPRGARRRAALPAPYSPDFTPIEEAFSKFKAILGALGARTHDALQEA